VNTAPLVVRSQGDAINPCEQGLAMCHVVFCGPKDFGQISESQFLEFTKNLKRTAVWSINPQVS
jgi:hypothetical protein